MTEGAKGPHTAVMRRRIYIGAPAEEVWRWLVEPELSDRYHLANLLARPEAEGDPVQYTGKLGGQLLIDGAVLEIVESRRLVHTFEYPPDANALFDPDPPSRVRYELIRYGERMCCLELVQEEFNPRSDAYNSIESSWDVVLSSLKTLVETGAPLPWPGRRDNGRG